MMRLPDKVFSILPSRSSRSPIVPKRWPGKFERCCTMRPPNPQRWYRNPSRTARPRQRNLCAKTRSQTETVHDASGTSIGGKERTARYKVKLCKFASAVSDPPRVGVHHVLYAVPSEDETSSEFEFPYTVPVVDCS